MTDDVKKKIEQKTGQPMGFGKRRPQAELLAELQKIDGTLDDLFRELRARTRSCEGAEALIDRIEASLGERVHATENNAVLLCYTPGDLHTN